MKHFIRILFAFVLTVAAAVAEPSVVITGAGYSDINGTYTYSGVTANKPAWQKAASGGGFNTIFWSTSAPVASGAFVINRPAGNAYYGQIGATELHATTWTLGAFGSGAAPARAKYVLPQTKPAFPPVIVAGGGAAGVNGTYDYVGIINSRPYYAINPTVGVPYYLAYDSTNSRWRIFVYSSVLTEAYRVASTARTPDLIAGTWATQVAGQAPAITSVTAAPRLVLNGGSIIESGVRKTWDAGSFVSGAAGRYTLVTGTPTATPRALPGSSNTTTVEDRTIQSITGSSTVTDYTWTWQPADTNTIPGTVTRSSSNPAVITPTSGDAFKWTFVSNGSAVLKLTTSTGLEYNKPVTTSTSGGSTTSTVTGYATGSLRKHMFDLFSTRLSGKSPTTALKIFSTYSPSTATYVRNTDCWAYGYDLTSISPGNSQSNNLWAGALVTPRHFIVCAHASMGTGAVMHFVDQNNNLITRTVTSITTAPGYTSYYPDYRVATLDSDVPASISYAYVLPDNWATQLPSLSSAYPVPALTLDQEEKALVTDLYDISSNSGMYGAMAYFKVPVDAVRQQFYEDKIGGDSGNPAYLMISNKLVLLNVWTFGGAGSGTSITYHKGTINSLIETSTDAPYIQLAGATTIATPDSTSNSITGDIDIRIKVALNDWTPASAVELVRKPATASDYRFRVEPSGVLQLYLASGNTASSVATGFADGAKRWVRVTRVQSTGVVTFYTSTNGTSWTQLGTSNALLAGTALADTAGALNVAAGASGKLYYFEVRAGVDGTIRNKFDANLSTTTGYTDSTNSAVWTISGGTPSKGGYALQEINLGSYNSY